MTTVPQRRGNFTSSEIWKLLATGKQQLGFGVGAATYIRLTNYERIINRSVDCETNARPLSWGRHLERYVFDEKLGIDYVLTSDVTDIHPTIDYWAGSKDGYKVGSDGETVAIIEQKNPSSMNGFCDYYMPIYAGLTGIDVINAYRNGFTFEKDGVQFDIPPLKAGEQLFWQCCSNGIINECDNIEFIFYMPRQSELLAIKQLSEGNPELYWLNFAHDDEIPFLPDDSPIPSLNKVCFTLPEADKQLLTETVLRAGQLLIKR